MRALVRTTPTAEQLPIISRNSYGVEVICGAAGSGKTSTALMRLKSLIYMCDARHKRESIDKPINVLVLTFNRTLSGYVKALVDSQLDTDLKVDVEISTFAKWARRSINNGKICPEAKAESKIKELSAHIIALSPEYIVKEVDYLLGRFSIADIENYIQYERTGRGAVPRVERTLRRELLDKVVYPYKQWLSEEGYIDWNDLAVMMSNETQSIGYDIVIVDEAQDFSANQLRAIKHHLSIESSLTFVMDTVQRIYARGFTWSECGFDVRPGKVFQLRKNHRNTRQIANFAKHVLEGIAVEDNGALPDLNAASKDGDLPYIVNGNYLQQVDWAITFIKENIDLSLESVAFLKPKGGAWFTTLKNKLNENSLPFVEITRDSEWPDGDENIALCTFHSAKGLEFDHVFILGLSGENTACSEINIDDGLIVLQKLLAVAVARARLRVAIGQKIGEESVLSAYFTDALVQVVNL
ncbi:3'-5' exonuclease [Rheinheimera aquimaris]|uniref:DNA 3'-5' helicase n=1 Tax=Rheinheimera aquimaris TaxID=412437 RepID=A0ABN1E7T3_9GAMM|nr:UvrD-helicase domain-containing protein [Rheinheimera aquimaris]MCB5215166.1 AAA family ATPase [Rheinheimera aquimaris]